MIPIPVKPFRTYKWRWLSVAPTESLLAPPVFLGVLRVLARHEGEPPSSPDVAAELGRVAEDTQTRVDLVRTPERNLIRNSGQYWKGTGLLLPNRGDIHLTALGRMVAEGRVTQGEFASIMVQQTVLPNPWTYTHQEIQLWKAAELEIRPLVLILQVLQVLARRYGGVKESFITPWELIRICIPLAGAKARAEQIAEAISLQRAGKLNVTKWPDCTPASNDHRLAREFLLFLSHYGFCRLVHRENRMEDAFCLDEAYGTEALQIEIPSSIFDTQDNSAEVVQSIRHSQLPSIIERQRMITSVLARPYQARFRDSVFQAYRGHCLLTGDSMGEILEAAHIIPVTNGGADTSDNGICLRVDIHRLFDSNNIRLKATGERDADSYQLPGRDEGFLDTSISSGEHLKYLKN